MPPDLRLGYLVFDVRRPDRWAAFCEHMLGLPAPVAASALMSLNALAPGHIDFGISTGFTARRTMGVRRSMLG